MIRGILIAILGIAVISTGYWGYKEHQEKDAVLLHAENNYQRAFHDLTYQIDQLHDKLGATLAMNSQSSISPALADVWRMSSEAHNNVSQLPLTLMPFNKTEEFLASVGDFSYKSSVKTLSDEPLNKDTHRTISTLYEQAADVQNELRQVQHLVLNKNLKWMDVEMALADGDHKSDNTIIDGLKTVEKNANAFSDVDLGPTSVSTEKEAQGYSHLKGKKITKQDAIKIAQEFAPDHNKQFKVRKSGSKTNRDVYSVSMKDSDSHANFYIDVTEKGGYPVYLIQNRDVKKQKISLNDASKKALAFLKKHGYETESFHLDESAQYDNIGVFTFVPTQKNVLLYPDSIRMKIALDDGEVIGFSAKDYLANHKVREIKAPKISKKEAEKTLNKNVQIQDTHVAIINNDMSEEVLCYEFLGTIKKDTYRMFINADTGKEERIDKLKNVEPIYKDL
ncbi:germination protein YpeB [Bacillus sp. NPDC077027]|uniref:germination protein YpeB n=1 Tax=Bacillus sp. NPDC077027 TaxID=3390548 RepID=UPI003D03F6FB